MSKRINDGSKTKKISAQLLMIEVPMIALFIIAVAVIVFMNAKSGLIDEAQSGLYNESESYAIDIAGKLQGISGYYDGLADMVTKSGLTADEDIWNAIKICDGKYAETPTGCYIGFEDKTFLNSYASKAGEKPSEDYDCTQRGWYGMSKDSEKMLMSEAYVDATTGYMVVTIARKIVMENGRTGVFATDVFLDSIEATVSGCAPGGSGEAILLDGTMILASPREGYTGTDVSEHGSDSLLTAISSEVGAGSSGVKVIRDGSGEAYFVSFNSVPDTTWTMVSFIKQADILRDLNLLRIITVILVVISLIVSTIIIMLLVSRMITKPVQMLTDNIVRISEGDFSVDIAEGGENEIGVMNNHMHDYVDRMRGTLMEMREVTGLLSGDAKRSRDASDSLNRQATEQSDSMDQIHMAMDGVANSVTELANNATELATAVSEMTEQGDMTGNKMAELVDKARQGQKDMENVQKNMSIIADSMSQMSEVVSRVGDATKQINSIIDMINSISSQTNLLSLNASIEAARAGEAGKGFAVVAGEIGGLAAESAKATSEIGSIIADVTKEIGNLSEKSEQSVTEIATSSEAVNATGQTFAEIFSALDEAGGDIREMVARMEKVNDIATSVAAIAEEQSASTQMVTETVDTAADGAKSVADESRNVDESAVSVADSAEKIGRFVEAFVLE